MYVLIASTTGRSGQVNEWYREPSFHSIAPCQLSALVRRLRCKPLRKDGQISLIQSALVYTQFLEEYVPILVALEYYVPILVADVRHAPVFLMAYTQILN